MKTPKALGCGSNIDTRNGTLVSGNMDQNLRSPGGFKFDPHPLVSGGDLLDSLDCVEVARVYDPRLLTEEHCHPQSGSGAWWVVLYFLFFGGGGD